MEICRRESVDVNLWMEIGRRESVDRESVDGNM